MTTLALALVLALFLLLAYVAWRAWRRLPSILGLLVLALVAHGCSDHQRQRRHATPPAPWTLTTDPVSAYDEAHQEIERVVDAFSRDWVRVDRPLVFVGTPGDRLCGPVLTVGCNPSPSRIEFATSDSAGHSLRYLVRWVVAHDLFHAFGAELGLGPGRDPTHADPRWSGEWDGWLAAHGGARLP